jgi:hypothetical protein
MFPVDGLGAITLGTSWPDQKNLHAVTVGQQESSWRMFLTDCRDPIIIREVISKGEHQMSTVVSHDSPDTYKPDRAQGGRLKAMVKSRLGRLVPRAAVQHNGDTAAAEIASEGDTTLVAGVAVPKAVAAQVQAVLEMCSGAYLLTDDVLARTPLRAMPAEKLERIMREVDAETGVDVDTLDWEQQLAMLRRIAQDPDAATPPSWGIRGGPDTDTSGH